MRSSVAKTNLGSAARQSSASIKANVLSTFSNCSLLNIGDQTGQVGGTSGEIKATMASNASLWRSAGHRRQTQGRAGIPVVLALDSRHQKWEDFSS